MTEDPKRKNQNASQEMIRIKPKPVGKEKGTMDIIKANLQEGVLNARNNID